jgi:hypothetical protein
MSTDLKRSCSTTLTGSIRKYSQYWKKEIHNMNGIKIMNNTMQHTREVRTKGGYREQESYV